MIGRTHDIPPELRELVEEFDQFLRAQILPLANGDELGTDAERVAMVRKRAGVAGFYAPHFDRAEGGRGLGVWATALLVEHAAATGSVLARAAIAPPAPTGPNPGLRKLPAHLRDRYLPALVRGDMTMCFAMSEDEAGSDITKLRTAAIQHGDRWRITGEKTYITNGAAADLAIVIARTGHSGNMYADFTALVVPRDRYEVVRSHEMIGDVRPVTIRFASAEVPADHVIGPVGGGLAAALSFLETSRIFIAAQAMGVARWCFDTASSFAQKRHAFGGPLSRLQGVSFVLVDCATTLHATRALTYQTARDFDHSGESMLGSAMTKLFSTEHSFTVADRCMQILGARGLDRATGVEGAVRYLRMLRVVEGSSDLQRHVIAQLLGLGG